MTVIARWITVKCQKCDKVHCEASAGSKVRWKCLRCKTWQIVDIE